MTKENLVEKHFEFDIRDLPDGSKELREVKCRHCSAVVYNNVFKPIEDAMGQMGKAVVPMIFGGLIGWAHLKKCKAWKGN